METDSEIRLDDVVLSNGVHKIKILLRDGFGNETTAERTFIIEGNEDIASVYAEADEEGPTLNKDFKLYLKSDNIENIDKMSVTVNLRKEYLSELNVIFNGNFNGTFDISDTGVICIDAERISSQESSLFNRSNKSNEDVIATIVCKVPYNINKGGKFIYSLTNGLVELNKPYDGEGFPTYSFSGDETSIDVVEELTVEVDTIEVGDTTANLYVYDIWKEPVSEAVVYDISNNRKIGETNTNGRLDITYLCEKPKEYNFYAEKDGSYSFAVSGQSFALGGDPDGKPTGIIANANPGGGDDKVFTWISNPKATQDTPLLQIAEKRNTIKMVMSLLKIIKAKAPKSISRNHRL